MATAIGGIIRVERMKQKVVLERHAEAREPVGRERAEEHRQSGRPEGDHDRIPEPRHELRFGDHHHVAGAQIDSQVPEGGAGSPGIRASAASAW